MSGRSSEDPRYEADYETEEDKARRERSERIQKEIDPMPLSAFAVSELQALLVFKGFRLGSHANFPFLTLAEAENLLEQKLLRAAQDRADRADRVESSISRERNLYGNSYKRGHSHHE